MKKLLLILPLALVAHGCGSSEESLPSKQDVTTMSANPDTNTIVGDSAPQGGAQKQTFGVGQ